MLYLAGGPLPRTLSFRNSIFQRTDVEIENVLPCRTGTVEEQFVAANNLFYRCAVLLTPRTGNSWTFQDNIFDGVSFVGYDSNGNPFQGNGPVAVNDHNAYIGMSMYLTPENYPATDPKPSSLTYSSGSMGRFYLPSTATTLIDHGSRGAAAAGLYHFTTQTTNAKETTSQVDIGPHYLALVGSQAADSNGDGVPDFIADRDGDGTEDLDEIPWQSANNSAVAVLSPAANSVVSGTIQVHAALAAIPSAVTRVAALVDGEPPPVMSGLSSPAQSIGSIEIDTSRLSPGSHTLAVEATTSQPSLGGNDQGVISQSITFTNQTPVTFGNWQGRAQLLVNVSLHVDPSVQNYTLHFYDSFYPKAQFPQPIYDYVGTASGGSISFSQPPASLGYGDASTDPTVYSFTEMSSPPPGTPSAVVNHNIIQDPTFPCEGWWAAAYDDLCVDFALDLTYPVIDTLDWQSQRWKHYDQLDNGWFPLGAYANDGTCPNYPPTVALQPPAGSDPTTSTEAQTWPVRGAEGSINLTGFANDVQALRNILHIPSVRNFYGLGHGDTYYFFYLGRSAYDCFQRFRFVFLDGCKSYSTHNFGMFGAVDSEIPPQPIAQSNNGFTDTIWYHTTGLRPAAFMGHILPVPFYYPDGNTDSRGRPELRCIEAESNWHAQFVSFWGPVYREQLYQAKLDADRMAWLTANGGPSSPNPAPHQPEMGAAIINGTVYWWGPTTCIKIAGYQNLKFNDFNKAGDSW